MLESARRRIRRVTPELQQIAEGFRKEPTPAEALLWEALRGRKCGGLKFRRQHAVGIYVLDFWCPEQRLALELDGSIHELPNIQERDRARQAWIQRHGIRVLRFTNDEVLKNLPQVLATIQSPPSHSNSPFSQKGTRNE